jgi:hypothetical protein
MAPSSISPLPGESETEISLVTIRFAVADLEESAWLVAVTCIVPLGGRFVGPV